MNFKYIIFYLVIYFFSANVFAGVDHTSTNSSNSDKNTEATATPIAFKHQQVGLVFNFEKTIGTPDFDQHDAQQLQRFLTQKINEYRCDSKNVTFVSANYQQGIRSENNMVDNLSQLGYVVVDLTCEGKSIVFSISKKNKQLVYAKAVQKTDPTEAVGECDSCGKVKLSQSLINKFKDEDYGGSAVIDFGDDSGMNEENIDTQK